MKNAVKILLLTLLIQSCEQTVDVELPYHETIVVEAIIEAEKPIGNYMFSITKTAPPLVDVNDYDIIISDVTGRIYNDNEEWQVRHFRDHSYTVDNFVPQAGSNYNLELNWKGKTYTSTTYIPYHVKIKRVGVESIKSFGETNWSAYAIIDTKKGETYQGGYYVFNEADSKRYDYSYFFDNENDRKEIKIRLDYSYWEDSLQFVNTIRTKRYFIDVFDSQYYHFRNSEANNSRGGGFFGSSGTNLKWNIKGGIGLFLGHSTTEIRFE